MVATQQIDIPVRFRLGAEPLVIKWTGAGQAPTRSHDDDAGFDLYCHLTEGPLRIQPGGFVDVPCGVNVELPTGVWGLITGRSSTLRKRGLLVAQGVIDTGYRGALFVGVWNLAPVVRVVYHGERLAQLIPHLALAPSAVMEQVESLTPSVRGAAGFGSTGR